MLANITTGRRDKLLFMAWLAVLLVVFLWTRLDFSNRLYYFGDGNVIVELIRLILKTGDWTPDWMRLRDIIHLDADVQALTPAPDPNQHAFYNLGGYITFGALVCKLAYLVIPEQVPVQTILHATNTAIQLATLWFVYRIGCRLINRTVALWAVTFLTVLPLSVMEAHYERPEAWLCLLATAMVYTGCYVSSRPRRAYFAIGTLIGLSLMARFSQLFLGLVPAMLLLHELFNNRDGNSWPTRFRRVFLHGCLVLLGILLAVAVNTPQILMDLQQFIIGLNGISQFYNTASYPYAEPQYSYIGELRVIGHYFLQMHGALWSGLLAVGIVVLLYGWSAVVKDRLLGWLVVVPFVLLVLYLAGIPNFIERNFSSMEGMLALASATGLYSIYHYGRKYVQHEQVMQLLCAGVLLLAVWRPLSLDYLYVSRYIHHTERPARVMFQDQLKENFDGFWIKNLSFTHNVTLALPENPGKAPRLYQIEDLNEFHAQQFIDTMKANGFAYVAQYCSEFSDLPPGNLTIYHAAARNNYFVRLDEWPASVPKDYFRTNCQ